METVRNIMTCYCPAVKVKWLAYYSENGIQTLDTRHTEELRQKKAKNVWEKGINGSHKIQKSLLIFLVLASPMIWSWVGKLATLEKKTARNSISIEKSAPYCSLPPKFGA